MVPYLVLQFALSTGSFAIPVGYAGRRIQDFVSMVTGLQRRWREQMHLNRQLRELPRLNNHLLHDIGLTRDSLSMTQHSCARGSVALREGMHDQADGPRSHPHSERPGTKSLSQNSLPPPSGAIVVPIRRSGHHRLII
jgi:uncharacterized protein YjiS (DUF1127 family)